MTVVLGDEFDESLRNRLIDALRKLGATPSGSASRTVAGSQDLEELDVYVEGHLVRIEAETYIGLSVTGPETIVRKLQGLV